MADNSPGAPTESHPGASPVNAESDHSAEKHEPQSRPGLVRIDEGRIIGGVAGGLATTWGVHRWLVRAGFIVTVAFAGLGLVLYALSWLLMPGEGEPESIAQRMVRRMNVQPTWVGFLLLMAGALLLAGIAGISGGVLVAAGLLVGGYVLYRGDFSLAAPRFEPMGDPGDAPPEYVSQRAMRPPRPSRPRSYLGRLTIGAMLVVLGIIGALDALDLAVPTSRHYAAAALTVVGGGLLVGTVFGRSRGLLFLGLLLLPVMAVAAIADFRFGSSYQELTLRPQSPAELDGAYSVEAGELLLDLTAVDFGGGAVDLDLDVGLGDLRVRLPRSVDVAATANVRLGEASVIGHWSSGLGAAVDRTAAAIGESRGLVRIDADVRIGAISIHRTGDPEHVDGLPFIDFRADNIAGVPQFSGPGGWILDIADGVVEMQPGSAGELPAGFDIGGGQLILDFRNMPRPEAVATTLLGDGTATLIVDGETALSILASEPILGVEGEWEVVEDGSYYLERPGGRGPVVYIEGHGPTIIVEERR